MDPAATGCSPSSGRTTRARMAWIRTSGQSVDGGEGWLVGEISPPLLGSGVPLVPAAPKRFDPPRDRGAERDNLLRCLPVLSALSPVGRDRPNERRVLWVVSATDGNIYLLAKDLHPIRVPVPFAMPKLQAPRSRPFHAEVVERPQGEHGKRLFTSTDFASAVVPPEPNNRLVRRSKTGAENSARTEESCAPGCSQSSTGTPCFLNSNSKVVSSCRSRAGDAPSTVIPRGEPTVAGSLIIVSRPCPRVVDQEWPRRTLFDLPEWGCSPLGQWRC
jgi:hypothetical protein